MTEKQIEVDLKLLNQILWKYFPWFGLIVFIISSIGFWKIFVKVGRPGIFPKCFSSSNLFHL